MHPLLNNAFETQESERTFDYSRRRNLNPTENMEMMVQTSPEDATLNTNPEWDGNYSFETSNFANQSGITGKISIAVNQMSTFGDSAVGQENPDEQITEHWSILHKTQIYIGYITGENYFRHNESFSEVKEREYDTGEISSQMDAYGNRLRLIKLVLSTDSNEFTYNSELLNFNINGYIEAKYADSVDEVYEAQFGVWNNVKLQVDFGGDPRADYIIDNYPSNEEDEDYADDIIYQKSLNIYMSSNIAGHFDENSDGYNSIIKSTIDLGDSEDSLSFLVIMPDYVKMNSVLQVL